MKAIISLFCFFISVSANAGVLIFENDSSVMGVEITNKGDATTSTLYGGSNSSGFSSPADCTVKFELKGNKKGYTGYLMSFSSELMSYSDFKKICIF